MSEHQPSPQTKSSISPRLLILAIFLSVAATVVMLESVGMIKHTDHKEQFVVAEFQGVFLEPGGSHRLSTKPPVQSAQCQNGFLTIVSDTKAEMRALIVDYKNRPIKCEL